MQTTAVIYKTESTIKEVRGSSTSLVSSTSSPGISTTTMRPPPPPSTLNIKTEMKIERGHEEPSSSIPDLEFDGTTVLCRVCGDKASGFHYGVHSCEGCKGFFRRSIQQKIQYRPCTKNMQCSILRINRNRCQYCRLKKCIAVGMSRDAVRFGRVPKREKARILAAMQQSSNSRSLVKTISTELEDEHRLRVIVVQAHFDTCDFTSHKVKPMIIRAREHPSYTSIPPTSACPLNPNPQPLSEQADMLQDFSKRFSPAIRGVVEFAKRIPGFSLLSQDDQVTLLKAGVFEVLLVRLACMFDSQTSTMICLNGQVLKRDAIHSGSNARFLMDSMFDFAERLNILGLTDSEIGLFCSIVIIAPDRPGLRDVEFIQKMRNQLKAALKIEFNEQHAGQHQVLDELLKKMPDLRTLNQLHSDKLLAFKMTEQQQLKEQMWSLEEEKSVSPVGSTWSMSSTDDAKSPLGSVSSTESVCTGEVSSLNDYHHPPTPIQVSSNVRNSPLLAASLSGECPLRHRSNSGSSTSTTGSITSNSSSVTPVSKLLADDNTIAATSHLISNNVTVTPIPRFIQIAQSNPSCRMSDGGSPNFEYYEPSNPEFERTVRPERNERIKRMQQTSNENSMPVLRGCLEAPPLCPPGLMMETLYRPHKKFRHSLTTSYKDSAEAEPVNTSSEQCPYSHQTSSSLSSTHSTLAKSLMSSPQMTAEEMKHTDIIHNYIMRGDSNSPSPHVSAEPTVYSAKQRPYKSVITTTNRFQPYFSSPRQDPPSPESRNVRYQSQSPHSTSPTSQLFVPVSCNTPSPKMVELQVDIVESQPLNLSKKSPSPPPLLMKTVLPMEA